MIMQSKEIYLITKDDKVRYLVEDAIESLTHLGLQVHSVASLEEYTGQTGGLTGLVILDMGSGASFKELQGVLLGHVRPQIIALCPHLGKSDLLEAMRVGIRRCIEMKDVSLELVPALEQLWSELEGEPSLKGAITAIFSSSGGAGSTTVALNLAKELSAAGDGETLLIDLDLNHGSLATYLDLDPPFGVYDLVNHPSGMDEGLIRSTAVGEDGIKLLASSARSDPLALEDLPPSSLANLLETAKRIYPNTVIDCSRPSPQTASLVSQASDSIVLVMEMTVVSVRNTKALLNALVSRGVAQEQIQVISNRHGARYVEVSKQDAARALDVNHIWEIPNDFRLMVKAANRGLLIADYSPRSRVRKAYQTVASAIQNINGTEAER